LAQVSGRNFCTWEEKFIFDTQYLYRVSFIQDIRIIFLTIKKSFIKREGISQVDEATMKEFKGTTTEREFDSV
jgi:lipopolysaccharide/colanic/teichoic acid biosynthesis glycosyltransferase